MTTDPEEGHRQAQEMLVADKIAVGDSVRLKAGTRIMKVVALEDYGNVAVCRGEEGADDYKYTLPVSGLVKVPQPESPD